MIPYKIATALILGLIFMSGWLVRSIYEDNKRRRNTCGHAIIVSSEENPELHEVRMEINDISILYSSNWIVIDIDNQCAK